MPDLLFITQRIPYPPTKGEKIRHYNILMHLRQYYDVHLGCLVDDPEDFQHIETVRALCADSHFAKLDRRVAKILCLRGLLTGQALSVAFFEDAGLRHWVSGVMERVRPEAAIVCSSNVVPYILSHPHGNQARVADLVDVDSEKWRAYAEARSGLGRWIYHREWRRMAALEREIAEKCDYSTFVSDAEADLFKRLVPEFADRVIGISNGVDAAYFDPARDYTTPYPTNRPNYVFTGTMDYPPNADAVAWFAGQILPLIRQDLPEAHFHIVGANPSPDVQKLARMPGVTVTGRVPDVRPYVAHATAAVAPMRIARGIQNKVLEAMALARPVIVTSDGIEGIEAKAGSEVLVADSPEDIAAAAVRVYADPGDLGASARRRILADYIWSERLRAFDPLLHRVPAPVANV